MFQATLSARLPGRPGRIGIERHGQVSRPRGRLVSRHDLAENWQLLLAAGVPFGAKGTEFGGIDAGFDDRTLGAGYSLFAQSAWYF